MTTIRQALQSATAYLDSASPSARLDAEVLLAHALHLSRPQVLAESQRELTTAEMAAFQTLLHRRAALEPVAYIIGHKEFYGLDFVVDPRVLVPRPETELLVELALQWWARQADRQAPLTIADIGMGSGCLAVTLAVHLPEARVFAVDLSGDALEVAHLNVQRHGVEDRVVLLEGAGCLPLPQPVRLIVSNPPYTVLVEVDENVRRWEPHLALDGGNEHGFALPRQLMEQMPHCLQPHGAILMEIGAWQGQQASNAARAIFPGATVAIHRDLAGLERALSIET